MQKNAKSNVAKKDNGKRGPASQASNDLTQIVKILQNQLLDIKSHREKMNSVPSSLLSPKTREFFKNEVICKHPSETKSGSETKSYLNKSGSNKSVIPSKSSSNKLLPKCSTLSRQGSFNNKPKADPPKALPVTIEKNTSQVSKKNSKSSNISSHASMRSASFVDPLKTLKNEVQKAIKDKKTFTIRGHFGAVRRALLERGWVERFHAGYKDQLNEELKRYASYSIQDLLELSKKQNLTTTCKNLVKSKLLGAHQVDFYWGMNDEAFKDNPDKVKLTLINKLKRDIFSYTNKQGLCEANKNAHWYQQKNISRLNHPRSYAVGKNGDLKGFIDDFRITAAMSLLKWIVHVDKTKEIRIISPSGEIPLEAYEFAINECCKFIKKLKHEDIDQDIREATEIEWNQFLGYYYKIVHYSNHFQKAKRILSEQTVVNKSAYVLNMLRELYPYIEIDGFMNIWMLKPTASSRGRGIHICRTLAYMLKSIKTNNNTRYIVQKYIERPLLIYNTKFDIRQWFLISSTTPLTIWMYKECYLRFSSQTYNLRKLHESIHLTNNAVQAKYKNTSIDAALPSYNMWDSTEFQKYLSSIGYPNAFKTIIYPRMKENITASVLMHQDKMVVRRNCFELYGADFILTEDFQPWLLEINSNPALYSSTPVTSRMCPKVLEDVIKVVIDYSRNNKAKTGDFELIYREKQTKLPPASDLQLSGCALPPNYFYNPEFDAVRAAGAESSIAAARNASSMICVKSEEVLEKFGTNIKKTLKSLLEVIHKEKQKRELKHKNVECVLDKPEQKEVSV